jgi:hypothetical protein
MIQEYTRLVTEIVHLNPHDSGYLKARPVDEAHIAA